MISFSNINKQYGKQLLFVDASFQLNPGEKVGLVGPNGAGKTTLFRMVVVGQVPAKACLRESVQKPACVNRFQKLLDHGQAGSLPKEGLPTNRESARVAPQPKTPHRQW
jgi:energy-coupling factor transporter ATP-binding protein EcfA2